MITLDNVSHVYTTEDGEEVPSLQRFSLDIAAGERVCVVGPSGCGKSTLLRLIAGFLRPSTGTIEVAGKQVKGPGNHCGVVFQQPTLFPWLRVKDNIRFGASLSGDAEQEKAADRLTEVVGLTEARERFPHELSGGMQQRAQIARVLAQSPRVVLMDEPFGALDPFTREQLQADLLDIWAAGKPSIVFVTHSVDEALLLGQRVVVMAAKPGRILGVYDVPDFYAEERDLSAVSDLPEFRALRREVKEAISSAAATSFV